jgi:chitinase
MRELRAAFEADAMRTNKPRLLLMAAVAAGADNIKDGYDVRALVQLVARPHQYANVQMYDRYLDYVNVMSYDFHGGWENVTNPNAPLYSRRDEDDYWKTWNVVSYSQPCRSLQR